MTEARKKEIDSIWRNTLLGEFCIAAAHEQNKKAVTARNNIFKLGYISFPAYEEKIALKIAAAISSLQEFDSYLSLLEKEDSVLVEFIDESGILYESLMKHFAQKTPPHNNPASNP
ncbi:MAG: hypothetical protein IJQ86_00300 [Spirochaetia bacterium]|nr:hypothetical protein [Spirochaetia bacterium]